MNAPSNMGGDDIYTEIAELKERVTRLEERVDTLSKELASIDDLRSRVAAMNQKLDDLDEKLDKFMEMYMSQLSSNHRLLKFVLALIGMILSFLAAILGLHWTPP